MKDFKLFVDCGAPSLFEKLSKKNKNKQMGTTFANRKYNNYDYANSPAYFKYLEDYICFVRDNKQWIDIYSNLDVISNPQLTLRNQKIMEEAGMQPIPVFHLGCDERYLKRYIDRYEYIAIGGLVPNPTSVLIPILDKLWKDYLLDEAGYPRIKVHGFACTSLRLMERYPWYSVDSAMAHKLSVYGKLSLPVKKNNDWSHISISTRDIPMKDRVTPGIIKEIEKICSLYDVTIKDAGDIIEERFLLNFFIALNIVRQTVPDWPWNFFSRESKGSDFLNYHEAGAVKDNAWEKILTVAEKLNIDIPICKLSSFFYKSLTKKSIELKKIKQYSYEN